jgi:hypothetical protein
MGQDRTAIASDSNEYQAIDFGACMEKAKGSKRISYKLPEIKLEERSP